MTGLEPVEVLGTGRTLMCGVSETRPGATVGQRGGETAQRIMLLLPDAERLNPPVRLRVRDLVVRVLGTQMPPWPGEPALVTCQAVHPDLPDTAAIYTAVAAFDPALNRDVAVETPLWAGEVHAVSGDPRVTTVAGETAPRDVVTITLPGDIDIDLTAAWIRITTSRAPGLAGWVGKIAGEVLDSTSPLRRLVAHAKGVI